MYMVATYDVEARRTEKFRKLLKRYLVHTQYSVFCGDISAAQAVRLRRELSQLMRPGDRVTEITAENRHNIEVCHLTKASTGKGKASRNIDLDHKTDYKVL